MRLTDLEGKEFSSHDWADKGPIAINILASWCGPCRNELPLLEELNDHIPVYAIATQDDPEKLKALFEKRGNPFAAVGIDNAGQMMFTLRTNGIPTTLFLDGSHRLAFVKEGALTPGEVEEKLAEKIKLLR
jgi:cytochrome c biogenesis protein CcmG, thiol:disulfide interchange protein DsbE